MDIKEKQNQLLSLLKEFDSFARANGVKYFVASGTCLGAIREKGFIPWDGDIDILLSLPEYIKCENIFLKNNDSSIRWLSYKSDKNAPNLMGRIYPSNLNIENLEEYPYLDLFALVGMPEKEKDQAKIMKRSLRNYRVYWIKKRKYANSLGRRKSRIGFILKCLLLLYPSKKCIAEFEKEMNFCSFDGSKSVAPLTGLYGQKEVFPKIWIEEEPIYVPFCDFSVPVMKEYKKYLVHMYGSDYMTPKQFGRYKQ